MQTSTPKGRWLATLAGLAFTAGALIILMGPALIDPAVWTAYHVLTILTVFGTIAAGHLTKDAWGARHVLAAFGFTVLFLSGTGLVVYNSVGRQAETTDGAALTAEAQNRAITDKQNDIDGAKDRLDAAQDEIDLQTKGGRRPDGTKVKAGCFKSCEDWKTRATEIRALVKQLEGELKALGPQKPVNPKAEKFAKIAALFNADEAKALAAATLLEPFLWTLFFEIGSIVSLGFAARSTRAIPAQVAALAPSFEDRKAAALAVAEPSDLSGLFSGEQPDRSNVVNLASRKLPEIPAIPNGSPDGSGPKPGKRARERKAEILADIVNRDQRGEQFASQEDLRAALIERFGGELAKSTLCDWLGELEQSGTGPQRRMVGRCKAVG